MADYEIALSFAGEQRSLVSAVAVRLAAALGRERVFVKPVRGWLISAEKLGGGREARVAERRLRCHRTRSN